MTNNWQPIEDILNKEFDKWHKETGINFDDPEYIARFSINNPLLFPMHYTIRINTHDKLIQIFTSFEFMRGLCNLADDNLEKFKCLYQDLLDTKNIIMSINKKIYNIANENDYQFEVIC